MPEVHTKPAPATGQVVAVDPPGVNRYKAIVSAVSPCGRYVTVRRISNPKEARKKGVTSKPAVVPVDQVHDTGEQL